MKKILLFLLLIPAIGFSQSRMEWEGLLERTPKAGKIQKQTESVVLKKGPIKLRTGNLVIGTALIGASFATYAFVTASNNNKAKDISSKITQVPAKYTAEISSLQNQLNHGIINQKTYNSRMAAIDQKMATDVNDLAKEAENLDKRNRNAAYICGAASLVGVVTILTGLHRENNGIKVARNTYLDSSSGSLSAAIVF